MLGAIVASGGEALLSNALVPVLREVKTMGYLVRLDTNGTLPNRLADLPDGVVDAVAMDVKINKDGSIVCGQVETVACIKDRWPNHTFRLTWAPDWHRTDMAPAIAALLGAGTVLNVQGFRPGRTLDPKWASKAASSTADLQKAVDALCAVGLKAVVS